MSCLRKPGQLPRQGLPFPEFREGCVVPPGCPVLARPVPAGVPLRADAHAGARLSLDDYLVESNETSFLARVVGDSMTGFGIRDGDLLVVDRAAVPADRDIVVAAVDGAFAVKQLRLIPEGVLLRSGNGAHADILVGTGQELSVWGVVRWAIHRIQDRPRSQTTGVVPPA
jgi:DNA polymerase V